MTDIKRQATANWQGDPKSGSGTLSSESNSFDGAEYSFPSRFENEAGSNPEELIGAAHAACFNMVVAKELSAMGNPPEQLETEATVTLRENGGAFEITAVHLQLEATVPDVSESQLLEIAAGARDNCPVSNLLHSGLQELTMEATLK